ncbi:Zinc finger protein, partial [Schistosoma japonicum]
HKSSSHPTTGRDSGYEPPTYPLPPPSTLTTHTSSSSLFLSARKKKHSLKSILPTEKHPSSDEAIRSIVRNLTERFYALNYHEKRWKRQKRRKKSNLDKNHDSSTEVIEANLTNDSSAGEEGKTQSNTTLVSTTSIDDSAVSNATTADAARVDIAISTPITNREEERTITTSPDITSSNNQENTKSLSTSYSPSTFLTSLLVAQRVKRNLELKNKRARRLKAVAFECDSTEKLVNDDGDEPLSTTTTVLSCDVPSSPSVGSYISEGEIQFFHNKRNLWFRRQNNRSAYKNRCLKLQPKRKTTFSAGRRKFETSALFTNTIKIRRFACNRCSAVFRLSSRLRAHYLFQHGHIPESLGGLSPRPNEILFNKQWNSRSSRSSSNHSTTNHDNDTANNTSDFTSYQEFSLHSSDNTNLTPKDNAVANLTVTSTTASPSIPDKSNCLSVSGLITRSRRRITTILPIQSVNQSTQSSRRTKKQFTDTSMTDSNNDNNITSLLDEQSKTDEVSEKLLRKSNKFSKQHYCTECNTSFKSAYNLKRHRTIVHLHEYRYFCEHLARHFCVKQFVCEICNARFTIKHELDDHIAFKHSDERNFPCTECDQRFKTSGTLWRHKKTHEKRVYHLCPICSTSFTRLSNLNRHLLRTHKQKHHRYQQQTNNTDSEILINSSNKKLSTHQRTTTTTLNVNSRNKLSRSRQKCKNVSIDHGTNGLNQHDISSCQQQTVEQVIPVEIITPHLSTTGLSSDHHTVINIIADQDLRYSNIINISDNNLNKSVLINSSVSCADTSSSASSASSNIQSTTLSTQSHITVATTEAPIISTNLSGYQTVNLTDNSTVFMLNFSDLETNGHAYFEQADLLNDRHDNLQHNMLISVSDPIYHQATEFSNSLVVSTSSESSVGTLATSSSCSSSPPSGVPGSAITLQSNLLLPIQLTTNTFSPITSSSIIGSNGSSNFSNESVDYEFIV